MRNQGSSLSGSQNDPVCPKDFLQSWDLEALKAVRIKQNIDEKEEIDQIVKKMGVDHDIVKELSEVCGVSNLLCGDEPKSKKKILLMKEVPYNSLKCVKYQMEQRKLRDGNKCKSVKASLHRHMKYSFRDEYSFLAVNPDNSSSTEPKEKVSVPNVVLSVQITKCRLLGKPETTLPVSETFLVLGSQTLADLKDAIKCPLNSLIAGDYSSLPDVDPSTLQKSGDLYKSGFFFIGNVFYNDLRHADNKDYSKPILEWAKTNWAESQMSIADMSTTKFLDLNIRLGHYYLFTHQGNCEHSVQFQDMRLFNSEDVQDVHLYPVRVVERTRSRKLCQGCTKISARWIIFDSPLIPTEPCFLCQKCLKSLLYTPDGEKTSNFRAHHYAEYFA